MPVSAILNEIHPPTGKRMQKTWNLPVTQMMPFCEIDEQRPVLLVTSSPAWNAERLSRAVGKRIVRWSTRYLVHTFRLNTGIFH